MDILKKLMNNPDFHHIAETIIGYMDKKVALDLVGNFELLSDQEQKFLMKTLRRRLFHEAQLICGKTYRFENYREDSYSEKSIFEMFPFFIEALQELKTSEDVISFRLLREILLLLEDVIEERDHATDHDGFKLLCLYECIDPDDQDAKGPKDVIKVLERGRDYYDSQCEVLYDMWLGAPDSE